MKSMILGVLIGTAFGLGAASLTLSTKAPAETPDLSDSGCIPCGPHKPCQNPLTVCTADKPNGTGCCLGFAG
jgi:hypothetical protein